MEQGVDDAFNLYFMMLSPEVDVRAITLTFGNCNMENVQRNAVTLLRAFYEHHEHMNWKLPDELPVLSVGTYREETKLLALG